jgi:hypothetical protein
LKNIYTSEPENETQYHQEEHAVLHYWKNQRDHWQQKGEKMGQKEAEKITENKDRKESMVLDKANVQCRKNSVYNLSNLSTEEIHPLPQTKRYSTTSSNLSTILPYSTPSNSKQPISSNRNAKRHSKREGKRERERERLHQRQRQSNIHLSTIASKNRRLPSRVKNIKRNFELEQKQTEYEYTEYNLMAENIKKLGIAKTNIHNLTKQDIPQSQLNSLALGYKYIPMPTRNSKVFEKANTAFTSTIRYRWKFKDQNSSMPDYWIPSDKKPPYCHNKPELEKALTNLFSNIEENNETQKSDFDKKIKRNLNMLLENPKTLVITADKNLGYAIVNIDWYHQRCLDHLESKSYNNVSQNFLQNDDGQTSINTIYDELKDLIDKYETSLYKEEMKWILLKPKNISPMKFYITAKIHKQPIKGRPIVPSMTWITHHLSEWIANQLNPILPTLKWILKDSNDLLRDIHNLNSNKTLQSLPDKINILTADVEALYPNMDISLGLTLLKEFLNEINWDTPQRREFLLQAAEFVLTKGFIQYNEQIYQQSNGAAMGSPMVPPYANIFMYMLERNTVNKYTQSGFLILFRRFIDDILIITQNSPKTLLQLQNELNSTHPCIKLIWSESASTCNFLDINIWVSNKNSIQTNVYQKPLNIYTYLPFHSYHTPSQKRGFIKAEALRYARICSHKSDYLKMIKLLTIRLQRRGYPLHFIHNAIKDVSWHNRVEHLFKSAKNKKEIPLLYKIQYNPIFNHTVIRNALNEFTTEISNFDDIPKSLTEKVTICYSLPKKLHKTVLKARKRKGF